MSNRETENADTDWSEPSLMSTLKTYPNDISAPPKCSSRKKRYIESLMKNLITNLTESEHYNDFDAKFMIVISNHTFSLLAALQCDYRTFYDAVKDYIRSQCQLSDANNLNDSMAERHLILQEIRDHDAMAVTIAKKFEYIKKELLKVTEEKSLLENKLALVNEEIDGLVEGNDWLEKYYEEIKTKHIKSIKALKDNKKAKQNRARWINEAKTGIDRAKAKFVQFVPDSTQP